jgi:2,3-bisphosphoglycerate-independent phosphoglycerate mutase
MDSQTKTPDLSKNRPRPAVLCILDGWGHTEDHSSDAIAAAPTPNYTAMLAGSPHALLETSGRAVGLPQGQMGNSEVGHMNIGSGRIVVMDLPRIDVAIEDGSLASRPALVDLIARTRAAGGAVHLMGLASPGGVHSHQGHMIALAKILSAAGVATRLHLFLDGRDTPPKSAAGFLKEISAGVGSLADVRVATVAGRFYAMDRDKRWDRVSKAYDAMVDAKGERFADMFAAVDASYKADVTDEFVLPCVIGDYAGMRDGDAMLFANFRADRAREISQALLDPGFDGFPRARIVKFCAAAGMAEYSVALNHFMSSIFPPEDVRETLGEIVSQHGLKQLRIAETEKYAHVTFFLNGGREEQFPGEDRILIPSPKVATYDLKPEMSAYAVTDKLEEAILSGKYDLIVVNYANPDMVGHTGVMSAAVSAVGVIDKCLGRLRDAVTKAGGVLLVTADHGNVEQMKDPITGEPHTAHTVGAVPVILVGTKRNAPLANGRLSDVAPTILDLMGIKKPVEMTGTSLLALQSPAERVG